MERSQLPVHRQIRAGSERRLQCEHTHPETTALSEAHAFVFSALDFAKPKMPHKLEQARTIVTQGFSNMHQPVLSAMFSSWNQTPLFPAANRELNV